MREAKKEKKTEEIKGTKRMKVTDGERKVFIFKKKQRRRAFTWQLSRVGFNMAALVSRLRPSPCLSPHFYGMFDVLHDVLGRIPLLSDG